MLPFPNNPPLENLYPNPRSCYKVGMTRTILTESSFEVVHINHYALPIIAIEVMNFDSTQLDLNTKYSTESRTFASVEFFTEGYYLGHSWLTKERQILRQDGSSSIYNYQTDTDYAPVILTKIITAGFVPSPYLIASQPDPNDPDPFVKRIQMIWASYLIKPRPSVQLYVRYP